MTEREQERAGVREGDQLYYVPAYRRDGSGYDIVVTKVGRKWAGFRRPSALSLRDEGRFDISTFAVDGGGFSSPGNIYRSEDDYREFLNMERRWSNVARGLRSIYRRPKHITSADMDKIEEIFHLSQDGEG